MLLKGYQRVFLAAGVVSLGAAAYVYYTFDPNLYNWFPKCPFKACTGLDCPGCGSQRAVHALLHGNFLEAFQHNALLIPFIPYLAAGFGYRCLKEPGEHILKWRKIWFGEYAIKVIATIIFTYFILRNMT